MTGLGSSKNERTEDLITAGHLTDSFFLPKLTVEIHNRIPGVTFGNLFADILLADLFGCEVACEFVAADEFGGGN